MKVTLFDPTRDLIIVEARIVSPHNEAQLLLAVDTGASETVVSPAIIDELGYSARDGLDRTSVTSAVGKEYGYRLVVKQFSALGFTFSDYRVHVFDLAAGHDIDGLIGLSFLKQLNYEIRSIEGRILVERAAPTA